MENKENTLPVLTPDAIAQVEKDFTAACLQAQDLRLASNAGAAFKAASLLNTLRNVLSDPVMNAVFMPLMNTKIGFLTDHDPNKVDKKTGKSQAAYQMPIVRDALIDAIGFGLLPTGNQFNIIGERMYPTKEGFTALLRKIECKYLISYGTPKVGEVAADVECLINYEWKGEKKSFKYTANVKKDGFSSLDQIKGKAERKAKKVLYEYLTGIDFGDADEYSSEPVDDQTILVSKPSGDDKKEALRQRRENGEIFNEDMP